MLKRNLQQVLHSYCYRQLHSLMAEAALIHDLVVVVVEQFPDAGSGKATPNTQDTPGLGSQNT
jgi:hypothetical protein